MNRLETRVPPPLVGATLAVAMWWLGARSGQAEWAPLWRHVLAVALAGAGLTLDLLALLAFRAAQTSVNPLVPARASRLVTGGVYRVTRNPMYLGLALVLCGWAVYFASWWGACGPLLFVLYVDRFQVRPEERALAQRFGDEFERYARDVRRWL